MNPLLLCFTIFLLRPALAMASCGFSDGRKNINLSLLIGCVEIFAAEQLAAKSELSPLTKKKFMGWLLHSKTAPAQKIVELLEP